MGTLAFDRQINGEQSSTRWRPKLTTSTYRMLVGAIAILSVWIRSGVPITAIGTSVADDALFVQIARNVAAGHWLGPFYNMTLVKGPAYPIFIALSFWAGVPLKIAETSVYLATAYLTTACVRRLSGSLVVSTILFAALALNPVLWTGSMARVIREGLYVSLSLAVIVATLWLGVFSFAERRSRTLMKAVLCGLVWAAFWLTREEGGWLVPSVAVLITGCSARSLALSRRGQRAGAPIAALAARYGTALLTMAVLVSMVAVVNRTRYGYYETVEVKSAPFRRAYGAISRVTPAQWRRYVVFPKDVRERVYAVSTAARELSPVFDGPVGEHWRKVGCDQTEVTDCPEILSGWFQWALRDAVASAGHYSSASAAAAYYDRLADQVNAACERGALPCLPERATLAPPFRYQYLTDAVRVMPTICTILWGSGVGETGAPPSIGTPEQIASMADMAGTVQSTEAEDRRLGLSPKRDRLLWRFANLVARLYRILLMAGTPVALFGLGASVVRSFRTSKIDSLQLLTMSCAVGVAARIALLSYLEVTSIPSLNLLYASPASPLLITMVVLGTRLCGPSRRPARASEPSPVRLRA